MLTLIVERNLSIMATVRATVSGVKWNLPLRKINQLNISSRCSPFVSCKHKQSYQLYICWVAVKPIAPDKMFYSTKLSCSMRWDNDILASHLPGPIIFVCLFELRFNSPCSVCIKGSLGVRDSQKLPWDFQKSMSGSLGLPTFKDI